MLSEMISSYIYIYVYSYSPDVGCWHDLAKIIYSTVCS